MPMDAQHLVLSCTIDSTNEQTINLYSMPDSGATGNSFLDQSFAQSHSIDMFPLQRPRRLKVVDGRPSSAGDITHAAKIRLNINSHSEDLFCFITKLGQYPLILGMPWLTLHNPTIDFTNKTVFFNKKYCRHNCLPTTHIKCKVSAKLPTKPHWSSYFDKDSPNPPSSVEDFEIESTPQQASSYQVTVEDDREKDFPPPKPPKPPKPKETDKSPLDIKGDIKKTFVGHKPRRLGAANFEVLSRQKDVVIDSFSLYELDQRVKILRSEQGIDTDHNEPQFPPEYHYKPLPKDLDLRARQVFEMERDMAKPLNEEIQLQEQDLHHVAAEMYLCGASLEDIAIAMKVGGNTGSDIDPATKLPPHLHRFLPAFDKKAANTLPPHRETDHQIELQPGTTAPAGPLYNMSLDELQVLRKWLVENLEKGFIRASSSPAASPVLFARKPGGGLRFCVDYRALNAITIKNRYPLPLIQETLARLSRAKYYTKLDVNGAFNRIRIAEGHEWMTAFNTRYGLFETLVMPYGLTNAPATFQSYINKTLHPYLDIFCTAYIDDVLVFSDDLTSHRKHVELVLQALMDAGLQCDIKKCEFEVTEVGYLGMIISTSGVKMDTAKVEAITKWKEPENVKDVQGFLGFANFYRRFIKGFSRIVQPMVNLTKKDSKWNWSDACQTGFDKLKVAFTTAPVLAHFDPTKQIYVETDASDYVSSGILSQKGNDGVLHPVAFMSKKHSPTECNYEIYDKELLAIVRCFEDWRAELQGASHSIVVLTDHRNLETFMTTRQLSRRQVRWSEFLSQFSFGLKWRQGKEGKKPDSLTRRSQDLPQDESDARRLHQNQALLKPHNLDEKIRKEFGIEQIPEKQREELTRKQTENVFRELDFDAELSASPAVLNDIEKPFTHILTGRLEEGYKNDKWFNKIKNEMSQDDHPPHSKQINLSECEIRGDWLYFRNRLYVPKADKGELRTSILQAAHDSAESGHPGYKKLYEIVTRDYWWPDLSKDNKIFAGACKACKRNKGSNSKYQGLLKPLPRPIQRWRHLSVDMVGPLPEWIDKRSGRSYNCIMVVVCRLSKERHYIPCRTDTSAMELADLWTHNVWKLHGLPDSIVSDRGTLFKSELWKAIQHRLNVSVDLTSSYHPESDGQTEIANKYMEQYLRQYVNLTQNDWGEWLPLAEFSANFC